MRDLPRPEPPPSRAHVIIGDPATVLGARPIDAETFRLLILADLGPGRQSAAPLGERPFHAIDRDDLPDVLARVQPRIELPREVAGVPTTLTITRLDDFHPDALVDRIPPFAALARPPDTPDERAPADDRALLDDILERAMPAPLAEVPAEDLESFIRAIVRPHIVASESSAERAAAVQRQQASSQMLRRILHHPDFQSVEATWRALDWLTRRLETGARLRIDVLDVTGEELGAEATIESLASRFADGGIVPAAIVPLFSFSDVEGDLLLLQRLATMAAQHGAAVIAGAEPQFVGAATAADLAEPRSWSAPSEVLKSFRRTREARHVLLAMPRFILRTPYGADGEEVRAFPFEEIEPPVSHDDFLWGNSALLAAALLAESFLEEGWSMRLGRNRDVDGLPLALIRDGQTRTVPCAEVVLSESATAAVLARGPGVIASFRDSDLVRLLDFQSIADPPSELRGPWSR